MTDSPRAADAAQTIMVYMNQVSTDGIGEHADPQGEGHKGDLPVILVDNPGTL